MPTDSQEIDLFQHQVLVTWTSVQRLRGKGILGDFWRYIKSCIINQDRRGGLCHYPCRLSNYALSSQISVTDSNNTNTTLQGLPNIVTLCVCSRVTSWEHTRTQRIQIGHNKCPSGRLALSCHLQLMQHSYSVLSRASLCNTR